MKILPDIMQYQLLLCPKLLESLLSILWKIFKRPARSETGFSRNQLQVCVSHYRDKPHTPAVLFQCFFWLIYSVLL